MKFKEKEYLEQMSEKEIEQWRQLKKQLSRIHNRTFLALISNYVHYRNSYLWEKQREKEKEEHIKKMKSLPLGTKVIVKFYELAGETVEIKKHGRKYATVERKNGEWWKYSYGALGELDDENARKTAEVNKKVFPIINEILGVDS